MSSTAYAWIVIVASVVLANLPFFTERLFCFVGVEKSLAKRLLELIVYYVLVGALGYFAQAQLGQVSPQAWEFYAVTFALFLTLAFPGFVWRYLRKAA
jgi:hypothetical protein